MRIISYKKLLEGDEETGAELLTACTNEGCFWLDLESEVEILNSVEWLLRLSQTLHDVPQVEKWKYEEESPEGPNNIRYVQIYPYPLPPIKKNPNTPPHSYNYTTHPLLSPSSETDLHLSENWTFDLPPSTTHNPNPTAHNPNFNFPTSNPPTPLQNPDNSSPFLTTLTRLHTLTLTLLTTLIPPSPQTPSTHTKSTLHLSRYPTTDTFSTSPSQPLLQLREDSGSIAMVFKPVPGTCVEDGGRGGLRGAFVGVGEGVGVGGEGKGKGGKGKGVGRHLWDVGRGREGDWYEVCFVMGVGGGGGGRG